MRLLRGVLQIIVDHRAVLYWPILPLYLAGGILCALALQFVIRTPWDYGDFTRTIVFTNIKIWSIAALAGLGQAALAVLWHRAVLAKEKPAFSMLGLLRYIWELMELAFVFLLMFLFFVVLPFLIFSSAAPTLLFFSEPIRIVVAVLSLLIWLLVLWLWMRLALNLPASATGEEPVGLMESFELTERWRWSLWWVVLLQAVLLVGADNVYDLFVGHGVVVQTAIWLIIWPFVPLIGLATLTYMYRESVPETKVG